jgi:integrase/recombinase XerD
MQIRRLLKSFYFDCQVRNLTEKTIWGYGEALSKFLNFVEKKGIELEQVEGATIKEFIVSLRERQLSDHTINQRLRVLKLFFRYLVQEGLWDGRPNPMEKIKLLRAEKKLIKVLSAEEIERILKVPNKNTFAGYRNFCIIYAFYDTMIRLSELTNIKLSYPISI